MNDPCTDTERRERCVTAPAPDTGLPDRICTVLDGAHHALAADELAQLLLGVGELARPLAEGGPPSGPHDAAPRPAAVGRFLHPTHELIHTWADGPGGRDPAGRRDLGRWLVGYLDEVASRPRGAAIPVG